MRYSRLALVLVAVVVCSAVAVPAAVTAATTTAVSMQTDATSITENETATYQVVVNNTDGGVGAYTLSAALANGTIGSITTVEYAGEPATTNTTYGTAHDSVQMRAALADTNQTGSVQIAEISVRGEAAGSSALNLSVSALGDEAGASYTVSSVSDATLTVTSPSPPPHDLSITPANASMSADSTRTLQLTGTNFTDSVGTYEFELGIADPSIATIESVTPAGDPGLKNVSQTDPSTATVSASAASIQGPNAALASITITGEQTGNVTLTVRDIAIGDQSGHSYTTAETIDTTVTVTTPPDPVVSEQKPTDTDGDGAYEDVNGDGEADAVDVQALFSNREGSVVQENPDAFDYNDDGEVDVIDVQRLFSTTIN